MAEAAITIIGLGKLGSSIGLALKTPELDFEVIGHDKDGEVSKRARTMGAVDRTSWNLLAACEQADIVVLAIPFDQVRETLKAIGPELRPGCVVLDTSPLKQPVMAWAAEYLGEGIHFVGISLGINPEAALDIASGPAGARVDLFADSPCCLMPAPNCLPEAVKTAQDFATLLGATPHFVDPVEYDGLSTAVNLMPGLLSAALFGPITRSPGWREMRRLSSNDLVRFSEPLTAGGAAMARAAILSRGNVLLWLDAAIAELETIREQVNQEQEDALSDQIGESFDAREEWLVDWGLNRWEKRSRPKIPTGGGLFGQMFGFRSRRRPSDEK
ncbi:MAG: prephenate dehydrogenase/arogenate dehydrogenase family protein [Ardenticatenales bacterium]|nr:prephenate dehydrogenase/arogenate dehydrogenase family protein [Ardenticatenales bacterium]